MTITEHPELDQTIRRSVDARITQASPPPTWSDVVEHQQLPRTTEARDPNRWLLVAAASAIVAVGVGGLVVLERNEPTPPAASPVAQVANNGLVDTELIVSDPARPLEATDQLGPGEWVVPTRMVDGYDLQYSVVNFAAAKVSYFGQSTETDDQIAVAVLDAAALDPMASAERSLNVMGTDWGIEASNGYWSASRPLGPTYLTVSGPGLDDPTGTELLESLRVVDLDNTTLDLLSPRPGGALVAQYEEDGATTTLSIEQAGNWYCSTVDAGDANLAVGCATPFVAGQIISDNLARGFTHPNDNGTTIAYAAGIVSTDVARVDIEFIDGSVVSVSPMNLSADRANSYFVVRAELPGVDAPASDRTESLIVQISALDDTGTVIATAL
jgi:hypothetical protein